MQQRDADRIGHMLEAAVKAMAYVDGRSRDDLDDDEVLRLALTKLVEIVGEAAEHVSDEARAQQIAAAWFQGLNPKLDDRSPARLLRDGELEEVGPEILAAARAFAAVG